MTFRTGLAVILAGVLGCLANAVFAGLVVNPSLWQLATVPHRYVLAILFAALLPPVYRLLPAAWGAALALALLTLLPSLLAKLAVGAVTSWDVLLALNFVYALTALVVYRGVAGQRSF